MFKLMLLILTLSTLGHAASESCEPGNIVCNPALVKEQIDTDYNDPSSFFSHTSQSQTYTPTVARQVERNFCMTNTMCTTSSSLMTKDYTEFLFSMSAITKADEDDFVANCSCLRETLIIQYSAEELASERAKARVEINKKIKEAFGKKFVNSFSSNLEDVSFFLTKNKDMFKNSESAKVLQCIDPDEFNEQINFACKASGVTDPAIIRQRKDYFINSVDNGTMPFEQRLVKMSEDIVSMEYPAGPGFPKGTVYTRLEYDNARMGLAHSDPKAKVLEEILKKLILSKSFMPEMEKFLDRMSPALAFESIISQRAEDPSALASLNLSPEAFAVIKNGQKIRESFQFLMNTHPGFMSLMEDEEVLRNLYGEMSIDSTKSVLENLESNPHVLEPVWGKKCIEMQQEFALAVCTPDDKLISTMNPEDYYKLLKPEVNALDAESGDIGDLLMCEEYQESSEKLNGLSMMNPNTPSHRSDYLERLTVPDVKQHKNMFSKSMLASMNKDFRDKMSVMSARGLVLSKSVSMPGILSARVYAKSVAEDKAFSFGKPAMSKSDAKKLLKADQEYTAKQNEAKLAKREKAKQSELKDASQYSTVPKAQEAQVNTSNVANVARTVTQQTEVPRQQLQRKLSETYNPSQISKALDRLNDENAAELNSLRSQNIDLLQRTFDLESQRMESMQKKVDELQARVDRATAPIVAPKVVTPDSVNPSIPAEVTSSVERVERVVKTGPAPQASSVASSGTVSDSAEPVSNGRSNPAVIRNELPVPAALKVKSPEEKISEEVAKLIESTDPRLASIEDIKANGLKIIIDNKEVIVPYASLDQKTKDLLELKFAKKDRDQQVSKLAVLRMLISQNSKK